MNFFYEQGCTSNSHSSSSSSSSSSSQKILAPFSYHQHQQQRSWLSSSSSTNNNGTEEGTVMDTSKHSQLDLGGISMVEKEHMFDKVVTPSDVGKLNRLVIPKQQAEKYFPLDSSTNEKGLLLNFEDRNGKPWRFRYSYWNSSQSYVMTKGWSRFVKDKKLDAGDIVSFQRGVGESAKDRLFIDWRRRPDAPTDHHRIHYPTAAPWNHSLFLQSYPPHTYGNHVGNSPNYYSNYYVNDNHHVANGNPYPSRSLVYLRSGAAAQAPQVVQMQRGITSGTFAEPLVFDSVPVVQGKAAAKRLRLFGVNMDCPIPDSEQVCAMLSSSRSLLTPAPTTATYSHAPQFLSSSSSTSSSIPEFRTFINYHTNPAAAEEDEEEELSDKGKASMSLDLDI